MKVISKTKIIFLFSYFFWPKCWPKKLFIYFSFQNGSTSQSHNKKTFTYWSKQRNKPKKSSGKKTTSTNLFKTSLPKENRLDDNAGSSNLNVTEVEQEDSSLTDNDKECDTDSSNATDKCIN